MKSFSLQITYRKGKPFAAYIYLASKPGQKSVRTELVTQDLLIDYAEDDTPIGIEIVSPRYVSIGRLGNQTHSVRYFFLARKAQVCQRLSQHARWPPPLRLQGRGPRPAASVSLHWLHWLPGGRRSAAKGVPAPLYGQKRNAARPERILSAAANPRLSRWSRGRALRR